MLSIVTFKWSQSQYHTHFTSQHVNVLKNMVTRHYPHPFRFFNVTDDPAGLDRDIEIVPLWEDHARLRNPSNRTGPSCYRRLKIFSKEAREIFGKRILTLDLDTVIVRDMSPLWQRKEEFIAWGDTHPKTHYNGSMMLVTAGAREFLWTEFLPNQSPGMAHAAKHFGSDQGWISFRLGPHEARWGKEDGVYSWRVHLHPNGGQLPKDARIVMFHGKSKPWDDAVINQFGWVREHWK